jgi:ABC-type bacteriocin/lantibiotic exporter with double-glycine peptidase domain
MVTGIVIPIICLYFYWLTKKEMRESYEKWADLNNVPEEAIISGEIVHMSESKERYYYHRYVHVLDLTIQSSAKKQWKVKKITPLMKNASLPSLNIGDTVHLYGNWKEEYFLVSRIHVKEQSNVRK